MADAGVPHRTTTTAHTLAVLMFHILQNPGILNKVQRELGSMMSEPNSQPRWSELEQLPYLVRFYLRSVFCIRYFTRQTSNLMSFRLPVFRRL